MYRTLQLVALWLFLSVAYQPLRGNDNQSLDSANSPMRLRLKNNSFGVGRIVPSQDATKIGWLNDGFVQPFYFDLDAVRSISKIDASAGVAGQPDLYLIESSDGQSITGHVLSLDSQTLRLRSPVLGELEIDRSRLTQLMRADYSGEVIYAGLSDQQPWQPLTTATDWESRAGVLTANKQGAAIAGNLNLPDKCEITLELSWKGVPDFVVSLGSNANERSAGQVAATARLEVWNRNIVLVRETEKDADLARLGELSEKNPQLQLRILIDQSRGLIVVRDIHGRRLGRILVEQHTPRVGSAIHIANHGPSLSIERLEVRSWNGTSMLGADSNRQVMLADGQTINDCWIDGFDESQQVFIVENDADQEQAIPAGNLALGSLSRQPTVVGNEDLDSSPSPSANEDEIAAPEFEVVLNDQSRLKGLWALGTDAQLAFQSNLTSRPVQFDPSQVLGLLGNVRRYTIDLTEHRNGTLKIGDTELSGYLEEDTAEPGSAALRWHPHGSVLASAVAAQAEGNITYRIQLPSTNNGQATGRIEDRTPAESAAAAPQATNSTSAPVTREMVFVSGDTIDGFVERADEQGIHFLSDQTKVNFIPHEQVDRVWLNSLASGVKNSAAEKLSRLMTVPRSQKDDPPTHLLVSVSGDYLRGRLVKLDHQAAQFEIRSKVADIPRDKIAEIIWLHQRDWVPAAELQPPDESRYRIHVIQQDRGLTFAPSAVQSGIVLGSSPLLGECQVEIKAVSQLLFGPRLDQRIAEFKENPWVLSLAQLPKAFQEDSADAQAQNADNSPLVGKPAPNFLLERADGQTVRLSNLQPKVVVLDFWASWCGPCMKSLPAVHAVVATYQPEQVELLPVNIQESGERATAALERLGLSPTDCVLDKDGQVAMNYLATAIPQTVIIDSEGMIRFVFIGGGKQLPSELKDAIDSLLDNAG